MVRLGELEHGKRIADRAETVWNWASPAGRERARGRAARIIDAVGLSPSDTALELGCGTGLFTEAFATTGCRLCALDVSEPLLRTAHRRPVPPSVEYFVGDAERLPFADAVFDAVIGSSVLHHLNLDAALSEIRRVLGPRGVLVFAEPNMINPQIALQRHVPWLRQWAGESAEETAFVRWSLRKRLAEAGFAQISIEPFDFLHPWTPPSWIRPVNRFGRWLEGIPVVCEIAGSLLIRAARESFKRI